MTKKITTNYEFVNGTRAYAGILQAIAGFVLQCRDQGGTQRLTVGSTGVHLGSGSVISGSGIGVVGLTDAGTVPTTNPSGGLVYWSEGGVMKIRQSDGTVVTVANAVAAVGGANYDGGSPSSTYSGAAKVDFGGVS